MTVVGKSSAIAQYEQSKRRRLVTRRQVAISRGVRQMFDAAGMHDPLAEIVLDLARLKGNPNALVELPELIERACKMRADGGV